MFLSIRQIIHTHEWSEWYKEAKHSWLHYEQIGRYCGDCGETEHKILFLHCPTQKRTGEYCHWCKPYGEEIERIAIAIDNDVIKRYIEDTMKKKQIGLRYQKPMLKRNLAIFRYVVDGQHTLQEAEDKFGITRARVHQIVKRESQKQAV